MFFDPEAGQNPKKFKKNEKNSKNLNVENCFTVTKKFAVTYYGSLKELLWAVRLEKIKKMTIISKKT